MNRVGTGALGSAGRISADSQKVGVKPPRARVLATRGSRYWPADSSAPTPTRSAPATGDTVADDTYRVTVSEPTSAEDILAQLALASRELLVLCDPRSSPDRATRQDEWSYPFPLNWELQLRYLWMDAAGAFDVVASFLSQQVAPTVLTQVRFLVETYCLVRWLVDPEDGRQIRAYRWTLSEVRDVRGIFANWSGHDEARAPMLEDLKEMEKEVQRRAAEAGVSMPKQPKMQSLLKRYGYDSPLHKTLSDIGAHPGFASALAFFRLPGERTISIDLGGGKPSRAYFLGMAYEAFGRTAELIAAARGWDELASNVRAHIDRNGVTLQEVTRLIAVSGS